MPSATSWSQRGVQDALGVGADRMAPIRDPRHHAARHRGRRRRAPGAGRDQEPRSHVIAVGLEPADPAESDRVREMCRAAGSHHDVSLIWHPPLDAEAAPHGSASSAGRDECPGRDGRRRGGGARVGGTPVVRDAAVRLEPIFTDDRPPRRDRRTCPRSRVRPTARPAHRWSRPRSSELPSDAMATR